MINASEHEDAYCDGCSFYKNHLLECGVKLIRDKYICPCSVCIVKTQCLAEVCIEFKEYDIYINGHVTDD